MRSPQSAVRSRRRRLVVECAAAYMIQSKSRSSLIWGFGVLIPVPEPTASSLKHQPLPPGPLLLTFASSSNPIAHLNRIDYRKYRPRINGPKIFGQANHARPKLSVDCQMLFSILNKPPKPIPISESILASIPHEESLKPLYPIDHRPVPLVAVNKINLSEFFGQGRMLVPIFFPISKYPCRSRYRHPSHKKMSACRIRVLVQWSSCLVELF
ncbi:hypothetical protein PGT21_014076 [Puccinia graminis f. sp. tritici]|uniref:Uncharacterized protein n=1 Tax=Puccinia graminis f. sp. tritici TaxID=56615 RepID=A0A5B0N673_PUCGR|nr:hypothetical protein PGT21_014076 [Puccinia graminis f. sp. tritici]